MIVLSGAHLVLPDRLLSPGTLVLDGDRIVEVRSGAIAAETGTALHVHALPRHYVVPGFVDVHVHGIEGFDTHDDAGLDNPVTAMAARLPRYGVTAFCPTTVACDPAALDRVLASVRLARQPPAAGARVLPAHLESNFVNPEYRGAQPLACLRVPRAAPPADGASSRDDFAAPEILAAIERGRGDVGIVTMAPELDGGLELIRWLIDRGHYVSLGHSAATYGEALDAIAAGARQATHLFNRMPSLGHRAPGLAGAVLESDEVAAEIICDGFHVHPALVRTAVAAKRPARMMAITDGTAVAGCPRGGTGRLGGQTITAGPHAALLADGTIAGSVLTMDGAFRMLVNGMGQSVVDAAALCATTAAREMGLAGFGILARDAAADVTVLDESLSVVQTYVGGQLVYSRTA
jgi:N-acetylglucosamine-6-phosphate deacetylase